MSNLNQITERIVERLGLTEMPGGKVFAPDSQAWDCSLGALTFLFAMSDQNPMLRETADFRRERIDTERTPGEQSLDSGFWYRSQESWHLGAGLRSAEPSSWTRVSLVFVTLEVVASIRGHQDSSRC